MTPEAVKELRRATDLALRATKHTARAVERSMVGLVTAERHLWRHLTEIREKEKAFLLDTLISGSGLFGDAVNAVVDNFRVAKTQSAAFKQFMPSSPLQWLLKVRDTSGLLPSELLQVAGFVHVRRDALGFPPASVFPALAFTASLGHASTHEDTVSSPLLRLGSCPSLQGDPTLVSPLMHFTPLPLSAVLHTWRDLMGVSPSILRSIQFGYTLQFARKTTPLPFQRGSSYCCEQRQRGFCPATGSIFYSAQRSNRRGLLF